MVYTEFRSAIRRDPVRSASSPSSRLHCRPRSIPSGPSEKWHYEPALRELLDELLAVYLQVQLFDVLLESYASEQGARMITMEEATERANRTMQEYRILHNRLRREAITIDLLGTRYAARASHAMAVLTAAPG